MRARNTQSLAFLAMLPVALAAACVGDGPGAGAEAPGSSGEASSSGSSGEASSSGGGSSSSGSSSGGDAGTSSSGGNPSDAGDAGSDASGTAQWARVAPEGFAATAMHLRATTVAADARGAWRVFAKRLDDPHRIRLEWLDAQGALLRSAAFDSAEELALTGVRLDDAGNAYVSFVFRGSVTGVGPTALTPSVSLNSTAIRECAVARFDADGSAGWRRSFHVSASASGTFPNNHGVDCAVQDVKGQVLVAGSFTTASVITKPGSGTAYSRHGNGAGPSPLSDGFVAQLALATGTADYLESVAAITTNRGVSLTAAAQLGPTRIAVAGSTDSGKTTLSAGAEAPTLTSWTPGNLNGDSAALYAEIDTAGATSTGEIWEARATEAATGQTMRASATALAAGPSGVVVLTMASSSVAGAVQIPGVGDTIPLTPNTTRRVLVGIANDGSRRARHHDYYPNQTGVGAVAQGPDGRIVLSLSRRQAIDFGNGCTLGASASTTRTYVAFFDDAKLGTCTHLADVPEFRPWHLGATADAVVLAGSTIEGLHFGPGVTVTASPADAKYFATQLAR